MAHISTVFVRVVPVAPGWPRISQAEMFSILMEPNEGNSYCVPIWSHYVDDYVDLQYGARGSLPGVGPAHLWERREEAGIASIWIRFHDDSGDHDEIAEVTGPDVRYRWCRYGFDMLEAELGGDTERRHVTGSYRGGNPRTVLSGRPSYASPTTPACRSSTAGAFEPADAAAHEQDLRARASVIRYAWRGRLVRVATRDRWGWGDVGLDGWDNCVDPDYLAAVT